MTNPGKLFRTTTFRLALTFLGLFGIASAATIAYIYWNVNELFDRQLEQTVTAEIKGLAEQYDSGGVNRLVRTVARRAQTPGNNIYLVTDPTGRRIAGNVETLSLDLWNSVGRVEFFYTRAGPGGEGEDRLAFAHVFRLPGAFRLIVGRDIEDRRSFEGVIRSALLWGLGTMALVGLGAGWLLSRNLLRRVDALTATSRRIMSGDLTERLPVVGSGDELDRLSENLNVMLERIEQLLAGMREVSDNIAHDLRTPLNRLRNRLENALRKPAGGEVYRETLEATIEDADELIRTFNALLSIARLEAGATGENLAVLSLAGVVRDVADLYEPVAEQQGFRLSVDRIDSKEDLLVFADRQLLGQALANLIDNALKYARKDDGLKTVDGQPLKISLSAVRQGKSTQLIVADNGPGIPARERQRVLKRFVRLEASRSRPGTGLGLSLVSAVAGLHGGEIELLDNKPGLKAVLSIPLHKNDRADSAGM